MKNNDVIEEQIASSLVTKIKGNKFITSIEKEKLVADEIKKEGYLKEEWQREYAQKRIIEKIEKVDEEIKYQLKKSSKFLNKKVQYVILAVLFIANILFVIPITEISAEGLLYYIARFIGWLFSIVIFQIIINWVILKNKHKLPKGDYFFISLNFSLLIYLLIYYIYK